MGVLNELLESAKRFELWSDRQKSQIASKSAKESNAVQDMETERLRYSGIKDLNIDPGVFLESVIEGNDLMPVRYFEMGKLASRPVGRIHFDRGGSIRLNKKTGFLSGSRTG